MRKILTKNIFLNFDFAVYFLREIQSLVEHGTLANTITKVGS